MQVACPILSQAVIVLTVERFERAGPRVSLFGSCGDNASGGSLSKRVLDAARAFQAAAARLPEPRNRTPGRAILVFCELQDGSSVSVLGKANAARELLEAFARQIADAIDGEAPWN